MIDLTQLPQTEDGHMECVLVDGFFAGLMAALFNYYEIPFSIVRLQEAKEKNLIQQDFEFPLAHYDFTTEEAQIQMAMGSSAYGRPMKPEDFSPYIISGQILDAPRSCYYKGMEMCFFSPIKAEALQPMLDPMSNDHDFLSQTWLYPDPDPSMVNIEPRILSEEEDYRRTCIQLGYEHRTKEEIEAAKKEEDEKWKKHLLEDLIPSKEWRDDYYFRRKRGLARPDAELDKMVEEFGPPTRP